MSVHEGALWSPTLTLNLFDGLRVTAVRDRMIANVEGSDTWIGHLEGSRESEVFLTVHGEAMSGKVQVGPDLYEIVYRGDGTHEILRVDPSNSPIVDDAVAAKDFSAADLGADPGHAPSASSDAALGTVIDLMVLYTPKAKANAAGQSGIEARIANAVAMANQAYVNSKIDMHLNVVYAGEIDYVESGNMTASLADLSGRSDGKMDAVHALRTQYGADQVVLVTADANYCGIGYVMTYPDVSFAPYAFSVVHDDSSHSCLSNGTLGHELGHNQGCQHDKANSSFAGAYAYSYGYRLCEPGGFRTVMSYACAGAPRLSHFSNPNVALSTGQVTGTAAENNALSMNNTKAIVAAFSATAGAVATPPAAPLNLTASAISSDQVRVAWTDNSSDETGFRLERSVGGTAWTEIAVTASGTNGYVDTGLAASTSYQYRVRSYNGNGNSSYSNVGTTTTASAPLSPPAAPADLTATAISSDRIRLDWTDRSSSEIGFRVERSSDGSTWTEVAAAASNTTSYTDTRLSASTRYQYRVRAYNGVGSSPYSNVGVATTTSVPSVDTTPPVVTVVTPSSGTRVTGTVMISVRAVDDSRVVSYRLYVDGRYTATTTAATLSYAWNTQRVSSGLHLIKAQAIDASGNVGSASISVTK